MKNKNFKNFILMGTFSIILVGFSLPVVSAASSQDDLYDDLITQVLEKHLGFKDDVKEKYASYLEKDKAVISLLGFSNDIEQMRIILKHHQTQDNLFFPLMKMGTFLFNLSDADKLEVNDRYYGLTSQYKAYISPDGHIEDEYVMIGLNALQDNHEPVYHKMKELFGSEEKVSSFVFFHELGHKLSQNSLSISFIENWYQKNGIVLSKEEKNLLFMRYGEFFSDNFSLQMMLKRYPELNMESLTEIIYQVRALEKDGIHSNGLFTQKIQNTPELILNQCHDFALKSILIQNKTDINLDKDIILNNIEKNRNSIEQKHRLQI